LRRLCVHRVRFYRRVMGSSGSKRRKPRQRLPKVHGELPAAPEANAPTPLGPLGAAQAWGTIARASKSPSRRDRRAGAWILALPILVTLAVVVGVLVTR
jgi:hypothetical protein